MASNAVSGLAASSTGSRKVMVAGFSPVRYLSRACFLDRCPGTAPLFAHRWPVALKELTPSSRAAPCQGSKGWLRSGRAGPLAQSSRRIHW